MHLPLNTVKPTSLQQLTPSLLKHCKLIIQANLIHQQTLIQGITSQFTIHLISTYLAVNAPAHALSLLRRLPPSPSAVFWWNALIRRNIQLGRQRRSLELFVTMKRLGWYPDEYTFPFVFKACGEIVPSERRVGGSVHCVVLASGFESNVFVCNGLVAMYGRLGDLANARKVFDEMCERNVFDLVSWNSVVAACLQNGDSVNAIGLFRRMFNGGGVDGEFSLLQADAVSLVNILPACASIRAGLTGKEVHGFAVRTWLCEDLFVANALVDMYCKCNMMDSAERVFERMDEKDLVSWNAMVTGYSQAGRFEDALRLFEKMKEDNIELDVVSWSAVIAGYAQRGLGYEAMDVFRQMQVSGTKPNEITLVSLLSGCASVGALLHGKETHCYAMKQDFSFSDGDSEDGLMVVNALIDMYAKCKRVDVARAMFDSIALVDRTVVTWTVIIGGYAQHGQANEALELFSWMLKLGRTVKPNAFTISCALVACARLSALRFGRQIHAYVLRQHHSETIFVLNCLLDMYAKSGDINAARTVFDNMKERNDITWTSLMAGYGVHGCGKEALDIFEEMRKAGVRPDSIISLVVLYACSHSGMINEGIKYFHDMTQEYGVIPGLEHYACMVDLLGRAGRLDEAMKLIEEMPMKPCPIVWVALLSGCRKHGNVELGEYAANRLLELECQYDGSYTLLSNIYANASRWKDVAKVRTLMKQTKIRKRPGCSWVQAKKGTVTFYVGDRTHPETKQIYEILSDMIQRIKVLGYVPETSFALHDVDDEEKDDLLFEHSEKLALAYGILTTSPGTPIRITKNLRICGDCHSAITYISMIIDHEIILRDSSRFHHFKNGSCSCKGYW